MEAKNELTKVIKERYIEGIKKEKEKILDEYCKNTDYNRKYAIYKIIYIPHLSGDKPISFLHLGMELENLKFYFKTSFI